MMIRWGSPESKDRGLRENEVVIFSDGEYSDYGYGRVIMTTRAISADEIESAAQRTKLSDNGRPGEPEWEYLWQGDLVETLIADGAMREVRVSEMHCKSHFRRDDGPGIDVDLREVESGLVGIQNHE
jgi:hypothetical protein